MSTAPVKSAAWDYPEEDGVTAYTLSVTAQEGWKKRRVEKKKRKVTPRMQAADLVGWLGKGRGDYGALNSTWYPPPQKRKKAVMSPC